tara:strand:- start:57 stop:686 length:630 start_codon:yes stop_codon:yes gene_type:complete
MLLADGSVWRMHDLEAQGIARMTVRRAVDAGWVEALSRGLYRRLDITEEQGSDLAEVCARFTGGVICLLTAAQFHGLTDEAPDKVWIAVPNNTRTPKDAWLPVRLVRWRSSASRQIGVDVHRIQGVDVPITNPARTVVDMLRMMKAVGADRAMECLRDYAISGGSVREVREIADTIGVGKRLTPYLTAIPYMETRHAKPTGGNKRKTES